MQQGHLYKIFSICNFKHHKSAKTKIFWWAEIIYTLEAFSTVIFEIQINGYAKLCRWDVMHPSDNTWGIEV